MEQIMAGTLTPEQMRMQALIQALRGPEQQAAPVQQQGRVQSATGGLGALADTAGQAIKQFAPSQQVTGQLAAVPSAPAGYDWGSMMAPYQ